MKGYSKEQVGRNHGRIRRLLLLAACAALAAGGCAAQDGTDSVQNPAYVYYIKDADLMRADVNRPMEAGKNPSLVMEGVGEKANLKDYHDVSLAEDGSFLVFQFETEGDRSGDDAMLAAVNSEAGTSQLIYEGYANTVMCGNKLLFQVESKSGEPSSPQYDLYSYTPEQGKKLEASGLYNFFPSKDGSVICFTKMDDEWIQDLYMAEDGKEVFLADEMNYADANEDCSIIYGERTVEDGDGFYYELLKIGKDGTREPVLTKDKIHNLYMLKNTALHRLYQKQPFPMLTREDYISLVVDQLQYIPSHVVIERLTGDAPLQDLVAPLWSIKKVRILNDIDKLMKEKDTHQGYLLESSV